MESSFDKITIRKQRRRSLSVSNIGVFSEKSNTFSNDSFGSIFNSTLLERTYNQSMPGQITSHDTTVVEEMKLEIENLNNKLQAANTEIDNLLLQNSEQHKKLEEYDRKLKLLLKVTRLDILEDTNKLASTTNKRLSLQSPKYYRNINIGRIGHQRISLGRYTGGVLQNIEKSYETINLSTKLDACDISLNKITEEIHHDMGTIIIPPQEEKTHAQTKHKPENKRKHSLNILSANNRNKIWNIAHDTLGEEFNICHYTKPNAGIVELLGNVDNMLNDLTMDDYFVIMIGEDDFLTTKNYRLLVELIRAKLDRFSNTNIIISLPTFRCGQYQDVYNWRVETFNNLLYKDTMANGYAYLLDSNLHLTYNDIMFTGRKGLVNNRGIRQIFNDAKTLVSYIMEQNRPLSEIITRKTIVDELETAQQQLFRDKFH